jgi:hypothetical protein
MNAGRFLIVVAGMRETGGDVQLESIRWPQGPYCPKCSECY